MANFNFNAVWVDGVYQLEQTDPVVGGQNGISNLAPRQLSARTDFLFKSFEVAFGNFTEETPNGLIPLNSIKLPVKSGGTGLDYSAPGNYLRGTEDGGYELVTADQIKSHIKSVSYYNDIEVSKKEDVIYVKGKGNLEWVTFGGWSGYASLLIGMFIFDTTLIARSMTIDAIGGVYKKSQYPALWAWVNAQNKVVSAANWKKGTYFFVDLGGDDFRVPDIRDQFIRATGTDVDIANARELGSAQGDAIRNITGRIYSGSGGQGTSSYVSTIRDTFGAFGDGGGVQSNRSFSNALNTTPDPAVASVLFDASKVVPTSSENRTSNTAFAARIICV